MAPGGTPPTPSISWTTAQQLSMYVTNLKVSYTSNRNQYENLKSFSGKHFCLYGIFEKITILDNFKDYCTAVSIT